MYVNRNQIGAIVGSQPFGGTGLSGTGPKAGGPDYLLSFRAPKPASLAATPADQTINALPKISNPDPQRRSETTLPGPTGELNRLEHWTRAPLLCLGPGTETAQEQAEAVRALGGHAITAPSAIEPDHLTSGPNYAGVIWWGDAETARQLDVALSKRSGPILPLITTCLLYTSPSPRD